MKSHQRKHAYVWLITNLSSLTVGELGEIRIEQGYGDAARRKAIDEKMIDRMVKDGLIEYRKGKYNTYSYVLTEEGEAFVESLAETPEDHGGLT